MKRNRLAAAVVGFLVLAVLGGCSAAGLAAEGKQAETAQMDVKQANAKQAEATAETQGGTGPEETGPETGSSETETDASALWPETELPVSLRYDRMWVYSAYAETEDPEVIGGIVEAVQALEVTGKEGSAVEDYTDLLLFTFADGHTRRLRFEEESWVTEEGRYLQLEGDGLARLRRLLDELLGEKVLR